MPFKFEKLDVWKAAVELSGLVSEITTKFPKQEQFVLTSQRQRAVDSVSLNIAEGSTGQSAGRVPTFLRFFASIWNRGSKLYISGQEKRNHLRFGFQNYL
jgi:hypothetical protein